MLLFTPYLFFQDIAANEAPCILKHVYDEMKTELTELAKEKTVKQPVKKIKTKHPKVLNQNNTFKNKVSFKVTKANEGKSKNQNLNSPAHKITPKHTRGTKTPQKEGNQKLNKVRLNRSIAKKNQKELVKNGGKKTKTAEGKSKQQLSQKCKSLKANKTETNNKKLGQRKPQTILGKQIIRKSTVCKSKVKPETKGRTLVEGGTRKAKLVKTQSKPKELKRRRCVTDFGNTNTKKPCKDEPVRSKAVRRARRKNSKGVLEDESNGVSLRKRRRMENGIADLIEDSNCSRTRSLRTRKASFQKVLDERRFEVCRENLLVDMFQKQVKSKFESIFNKYLDLKMEEQRLMGKSYNRFLKLKHQWKKAPNKMWRNYKNRLDYLIDTINRK